MESQNQIKRCLSDANAIAQVQGILARGEETGRAGLARRLCEHHGFYDARGRPQLSGCLKALNELSTSGHFDLPAPRSRPGTSTPRRLAAPVSLPVGVPDTAGAVEDLKLLLVSNEQQRRVWNELMFEHPCGPGPLVGCQLRYLISSAHGWLGGGWVFRGGAQLTRPGRVDWLG